MADLKRYHDAVLNNNADIAKTLIDNGLDPNAILEACSCPNSCKGYTLLYMACVHDRMTIVSILLQAEADPDRCNRNDEAVYPLDYSTRSPFTHAINHRNLELMRVLLRETKVHVDLQIEDGWFPRWSHLPYGQFRQFHDDDDVISVLMDAELPKLEDNTYHLHLYTNLSYLLHASSVHRCSKLCKVLVDHYGIEKAVFAVLACDVETDTMSYLIDVYGVQNFVENVQVKNTVIMDGTDGMLELLMDRCYQLYGDNKAWWKEQMVEWCLPAPTFRRPLSFMHSCINAFGCSCKFISLLRCGIYSVLPDFKHTESVIYELASRGEIKGISVFISIYPQCLQEPYWMGSEHWSRIGEQEVAEYNATLVEKRQHVPRLQILCRSVIFHALGINPIPKAKRLPLPKSVKDFVQCKEVFDSRIACRRCHSGIISNST